MKKLLCVVLALLATLCLLSMTVSAKSTPVLSDDLQTLTVGDRTYSQADLSSMDLYYEKGPYEIQLSQNLQSQLKSAVVYSTGNSWVMSVDLYYQNGARMDLCFVEDSVLPELQQICQDDDVVCGIELWWENSPSVTATIAQFKDTPATLTQSEVWYSDYYNVIYEYRELDTWVYRGFICVYQNEYYYVDYQENSIYNPTKFSPDEGPDLYKAYKITDPELSEQIHNALESELSGTTELGQALSASFLSFVFAVIPTAILILSIILFIRSKGYYRITWGITGGLCIAELIVFLILYLFMI